ncbi:MAG: protein-ADP-ribose hydrolase [Lachnospiraceae bacterium]|uniref:Protein-ADP-ribose hydrolase n=1 Tax=Candidatus Weimeria bifida TaxID=2599074 RepID=A0A6N7IYR8_9FIRM|nr:protein-ADP-ribose hydrolase [Candidatus Weimeria bifida]RRF95549.1 MAG: protein-ADP-ribose hydrolase [Lachnospiraceae bacterium]
MTQEERLDYLVEAFKADSIEYSDIKTPDDTDGKRRLLRSLMNIRMPKKLPAEVLAIQDEYLQERAREKGIVEISDIPEVCKGIAIWQGDITRLAADAIVNAANSQMLGCFVPMHTCIDNVIHSQSGIELREYMHQQMEKMKQKYGRDYEQPTAVPMLSPAFNLPAKHVIHVVGPIVSPYLTQTHKDQLAQCYLACLDLAASNECDNIAFCCISTGVFMFPPQKAAEIAVATVKQWLDEHPDSCMKKVIFNVFKDSDMEIYEKLLGTADRDARGFKRIR